MSSKKLVMSLCQLQSQLMRQIDQCLYVHGISYSEYLVMHCLYNTRNKSLRRIDLATQVGLSASGVTRLLNPMEKNHLVKKAANPRDARVSLVELTKTGEKVLINANVDFEHAAENILSPLSPSKKDKLMMLIDELKTAHR